MKSTQNFMSWQWICIDNHFKEMEEKTMKNTYYRLIETRKACKGWYEVTIFNDLDLLKKYAYEMQEKYFGSVFEQIDGLTYKIQIFD